MLRGGPAFQPDKPPRLGPGKACFPRDNRLTSPAQFQQVFKNARIRSTDTVLTVLAARNKLSRSRLGLAVSRKSARRAVARNRVKRLIRESFRVQKSRLAGLDIVVVTKPGIEAKTNKELRAALAEHWEKLGRQCRTY